VSDNFIRNFQKLLCSHLTIAFLQFVSFANSSKFVYADL